MLKRRFSVNTTEPRRRRRDPGAINAPLDTGFGTSDNDDRGPNGTQPKLKHLISRYVTLYLMIL